MPWDPDRYHLFKKERTEPFEDLLKMVHVRPGLKVIDLGCGTGELTSRLADHLPGSDVLGIDASPTMLERSRPFQRPGLRFELQDIASVTGEYDLVFSNAAVQWVQDHEQLVPRLFSLVRQGGQIAIQLPSNRSHISHQLIEETAGEAPYREALEGWILPLPMLPLDRYAELLYAAGGSELLVFEKVYPHILGEPDDLAKWVSGTALVPYFERLGPELSELFLKRYRQRLEQVFPAGPVFYGFRRILFSAIKEARV